MWFRKGWDLFIYIVDYLSFRVSYNFFLFLSSFHGFPRDFFFRGFFFLFNFSLHAWIMGYGANEYGVGMDGEHRGYTAFGTLLIGGL